MSKIEIKNRWNGNVIFTYEKENATIKDAVEQAVKEGVNLSYSNLSGSDLSYSNLRGSDLIGSDLSGSDLSGSDLIYSNLSGSDLRGSDLIGSDLSGSDLSGSDLSEANKVPMFCKWSHGTKGDLIQIGCENRTIEQWDEFFASDEILITERNTQEFKQIEAVYLAYKAYLTHLKS